MHWGITDLDREARGEAELDEVPEPGEVCAGASHQVDDGGDLLHQREGVLLAHPQRPLKPDQQQHTPSFTSHVFQMDRIYFFKKEIKLVIYSPLGSDGELNGAANVSVLQVKVRVKILLRRDGGRICRRRVFQS